ncbi:MAG: TonB-dependent receptor [Galbibacter orientalis]|uniref:SusC/RagA family TonB-linked outer membrane protein n=1 Tax=Galbibacter orientalis TaxID=453852 RepID=UPI0030017128
MKKQFLLIILCSFFCLGASAQTIIKGTVVSKIDGMPIPGATIIPNDESSKGTTTDFDGNFTVNVATNSGVITVSYIGYKSTTLKYVEGSHLNIEMEEEINALEEVLLIGYGSAKKGDITSAIAKVENIETISSRPVTNFTDFLQGNLPGVTVLQQGGDPSAAGRIVIRGQGSLADESPLTVVDGVPYYGPPINPNDIKSVSVLKDAASAAIYGAQAASGVIVIETKNGIKGKPVVSVDMYTAFQSATNLPSALNAKQQADIYNLAADNSGKPRQSAHNATENPWGQVTRTDWVDEIFRDAPIYNANVNVSGASDNVNYLTSFNYNKKEGVLVGTQSERYSFRVKTDIDVTDKFTVGENVYYSSTEATGTNTSSGYSGTIINAIYMPSAAPVYDEQGEFHGVAPADLSQFAGAYGDVYNPMALLLRPTTTNPVNFINANVYGKYDILDGLSFKSSYSYNYTNTDYKRFVPRVPESGRTNEQNFLYQSYSNRKQWVWDNQLTYAKTFGSHNLNLTAIHSAQKVNYEYYYQEGRGFSNEGSFNQYMGNATEIRTPITEVYEDALTSAIGRLMYNFDSRYFISASIRRDETSRLATDNQSDYFPAASAGWNISNESFFNSNTINNLKLRASWGQIGNINSVGYYSFDVPLNTTQVILGENGSLDYKGVFVGRQSNPNLKWETSESIDFGLDAGFFKNSLTLTVDYFKKNTKGMIVPGLEDLHQGTSSADVNGGEVENKGWEFAVNYNKTLTNGLKFGVFANLSTLSNELINLDGYNESGVDYINHTDNVRGVLTPFRSEVGQGLYSYNLIPYAGIFQSQAEIDAHQKDGKLIQPNAVPGDFKFVDTNEDGKIDNDDKTFMGSYIPDLTYSFGFNLNYKGFDLNTLFQGVGSVEVFNAYKFSTYNAALQGYNLDNRVLNAWSPENTNTDIPRISTSDNNANFGNASSWYLENGSYLRLKNVTLGYTIPSQVMNKISASSTLRLFFSGENLFTITDYSGMDPEVGGNGLDVGRYPLSKTYSLGLSFSF